MPKTSYLVLIKNSVKTILDHVEVIPVSNSKKNYDKFNSLGPDKKKGYLTTLYLNFRNKKILIILQYLVSIDKEEALSPVIHTW